MSTNPNPPNSPESIILRVKKYLKEFKTLPPKGHWIHSQFLPSRDVVVKVFGSFDECLKQVGLSAEQIQRFNSNDGRKKIREALNGSSKRKTTTN